MNVCSNRDQDSGYDNRLLSIIKIKCSIAKPRGTKLNGGLNKDTLIRFSLFVSSGPHC